MLATALVAKQDSLPAIAEDLVAPTNAAKRHRKRRRPWIDVAVAHVVATDATERHVGAAVAVDLVDRAVAGCSIRRLDAGNNVVRQQDLALIADQDVVAAAAAPPPSGSSPRIRSATAYRRGRSRGPLRPRCRRRRRG